MKDSTTKPADGEGLSVFGPDTIEVAMRARVRETIEAIVEEELEDIDWRSGTNHDSWQRASGGITALAD